MAEFWAELIGVSITGRFSLEKLQSSGPHGAFFLTNRQGVAASEAVIALTVLDQEGEQRLAQWQGAAPLSHPNLLRVFEAGKDTAGGIAVAYAVMEPPEEELSAALADRALAGDEAGDVLRAVIAAFGYLHARGISYGSIQPKQIVAAGGVIKVASDDLHFGATEPQIQEDVRALGLCLYEILTQRRDPEIPGIASIPNPLRNIIEGCLHPDPQERWTLARVLAALESVQGSTTALPVPEPAPAPETAPPAATQASPVSSRTLTPVAYLQPAELPSRRWPYVAAGGGVLLIVLIWLAWPGPHPPQTSPAAGLVSQPVVAPPPSVAPPVQPPAAKQEPAPAGPPSSQPPSGGNSPNASPETAGAGGEPTAAGELSQEGQEERNWRVIAFTYNYRKDAARELRRLRRKWPELKPEIFSLEEEDSPPFFISLGGRMTRAEAAEMRDLALDKGLPDDVFIRNYSH